MLLLILFCIIDLERNIDSLKQEVAQHPNIHTVLELNKCYIASDQYDLGIELLKQEEDNLPWHDKPLIRYALGDDLLFHGNFLEARTVYLNIVHSYPRSPTANDALDRLYLIEAVRQDTSVLKKLAHALSLDFIEQYDIAIDSLRILLHTSVGTFAYYYLAKIYHKQEDLPMALGTLQELNKSFPAHRICSADLLQAKIHLELEQKKQGRTLLEDIMVENPRSIYAVRALDILKEFFPEDY